MTTCLLDRRQCFFENTSNYTSLIGGFFFLQPLPIPPSPKKPLHRSLLLWKWQSIQMQSSWNRRIAIGLSMNLFATSVFFIDWHFWSYFILYQPIPTAHFFCQPCQVKWSNLIACQYFILKSGKTNGNLYAKPFLRTKETEKANWFNLLCIMWNLFHFSRCWWQPTSMRRRRQCCCGVPGGIWEIVPKHRTIIIVRCTTTAICSSLITIILLVVVLLDLSPPLLSFPSPRIVTTPAQEPLTKLVRTQSGKGQGLSSGRKDFFGSPSSLGKSWCEKMLQ